MAAAWNTHKDQAEFLLDVKADVNFQLPGKGATALSVAIDRDQYEMARLLLERKANPSLLDWSRMRPKACRWVADDAADNLRCCSGSREDSVLVYCGDDDTRDSGTECLWHVF